MSDDYTPSTDEAADMIGVSRPFLLGFMKSGALKFTTVGTHQRIALADLREFNERRLAAGRLVAEASANKAAREQAAVDRLAPISDEALRELDGNDRGRPDREEGRMSIHEQARAEAEKKFPDTDPLALALAMRDVFQQGFLAGHEAATRTRVVTVERLTDALYEATQDPDDIDVPDVAKRLHALLYDPEETR